MGRRRSAWRVLAADGDFDGDEISNYDEYLAVIAAGGGPELYAQVATDPSPFWPGYPALPAPSGSGAGLLAALLAAAATLMLLATRRRSMG